MTIAGLLRGQFFARLQWGRNFIVAERSDHARNRHIDPRTSMEPQPYRCGDVVASWPNWATISSLQWGRNFIVAETIGSGNSTQTGPWLQWGRNFIVAETRLCVGFRRGGASVSMGPQLYRCGNCQWPQYQQSAHSSFNGAAALSLRKSVTANYLARHGLCFNGAATLLLRKCLYSEKVDVILKSLQWGRNFIVAEILPYLAKYTSGSKSLQWGRNFIVAEIVH